MRYVIWHVERSGSNLLCNLLSQTGYAGLNDYENCGFYIGHSTLSLDEFKTIESDYFARQRTPNGIEGCKAGLSYIRTIESLVSWEAAMVWFQAFDKHIILKRRDITAQAVSFLFAGETKEYTSHIKTDRPRPAYDYDRIAQIIADIEGAYCSLETWLELQKKGTLTLYYEDIVTMQALSLSKLINYLEIREIYTPQIASIEKQSDSLKSEYIERFKRECKP